MRLRTLLAATAVHLGTWLRIGLLDLALVLDRRLVDSRPLRFRPRPWLGVVILVLLAMGVGTTGWVAVEAATYVVHRLVRQDEQ